MVPAKGVERWLTQRLSPPARHRAARRRRGLRRGPVPQPAVAGRRCCSAASATTRGTPTGWSGRCSTTIDASLGEPWCATLAAAPRPRARRRRRRAAPQPALLGRASGWPASSRRTPCSGRRCVTDWRDGRDTDGAGGALADDLRWQAELWRRLLAAGRTRRRPTSATPRPLARARRPAATSSTCPARLSLFGHTRLPVTEVAAAGGARRAPRRAPLAAAARRRRSGTTLRRARRRRRPRRRRPRPTAVGHPLLASLGRDARELRRTPRRPSTPTATPPRRPGGARHAARLAPARPARQPRPDRRRARRPSTRRRRPQPAGARLPRRRPARSTCSARCWSGCSRTTRRSSRATSS